MAQILGSSAGTYSTAKALYASNAGAWVEVPLGGGTAPAPAWTRPADWLPTNVVATEQKVQLLVHVGADAAVETNRVMAFSAAPAYTVNWGDGSAVENIATGVVAKHLYNPTSLAGTATSTGMLQAVVTITPQAGVFTALDLSQAYYVGKTWRAPVVDAVISTPGSTFTSAPVFGSATAALARVEFKAPLVTQYAVNMFQFCYSLREIIGELRVTATGSVIANLFSGCYLLTKFPTITITGNPWDAGNVFANCASMVDVPQFACGTQTTNFTGMFNGCTNLREVPAWLSTSTSNGTDFSSMFSGCVNLVTAPVINTSKGTTFASMFSGCTNLVSAPALDTSKGLTFTSMFSGCTKLTTVPALTTPLATNMQFMFQNCYSLGTVSLSSTAAVTTFNTMFNNCYNLTSVTGLDLAGPTSSTGFTSWLAGCSRLVKLGVLPGKGPRFTHTLAAANLDTAALNDYYTQLPTVTAQTLTVTSLPGTLADDPTIATAKGWTVTGS